MNATLIKNKYFYSNKESRPSLSKCNTGYMSRGGSLVVGVLAFYSVDPSLTSAEVCNFSVKLLLERTIINKKEPKVGPFKKQVA